MISLLKRHIYILLLLALSLTTHFAFWSYPKEAVFDEVYFTSFASSYLSNTYYFDLHPPFAKLLITGFGMLVGIPALEQPLIIGDALPEGGWILLRLVPLFAGIFLPLIIFYLCKRLKMSELYAFAAGLLVIFENSLLVQSRFILLDSILLFFGFLGLLLYLLSRERNNFPLKLAAIVSLALTFSVKWTGVSFIALAFLIELYDFWKQRRSFNFNVIGKQLFQWLILFGAIPMAIYASFFAIHFNLLYKSGPGDAFMSPIFQKTLEGNIHEGNEKIRETSFLEKFLELNIVMYENNVKLNAKHDYGSVWYTWPLQKRSIFYWESRGEGENAFIYYLGNPLVYLLALVSIVLLTAILLFKKKLLSNRTAAIFILIGYVINLLPFMGIGRVMFLYHYEAALVFGIMAIALVLNELPDKYKRAITYSAIALAAAFFLYFSPLTYGLTIKETSHPRYFWLDSWR
jgi:dolichyl-phosphate-mannose-protein mannosyltransferase